MSGFLPNFLRISRANVQLASLPHAILGMLLAAPAINIVLTLDVLLYVVLVFAMITLSCNINCLCDVDVDRKYKTYMSNALEAIGAGKVKRIIFLEIILISTLLYALYSAGYIMTVMLSLLGLFLIFAYSAEPIRFKKRGILSALPVFIGLYMLPVLGGWFLIRADLPIYVLVFTLGYAVMNEGITLVNTCEDYSEDKESGISTWAHSFGLRKTLILALLFTFFGGLIAVSSLIFVTPLTIIPTALIVVSLIGVLKVSLDIRGILKQENLDAAAKRGARKMPKWFMITRYPLLLFAFVFLI